MRARRQRSRTHSIAQTILELFVTGAGLAGFTEIIGIVRQLVAGECKLRPQQTDQNRPLESKRLGTKIAHAQDHQTRGAIA